MLPSPPLPIVRISRSQACIVLAKDSGSESVKVKINDTDLRIANNLHDFLHQLCQGYILHYPMGVDISVFCIYILVLPP